MSVHSLYKGFPCERRYNSTGDLNGNNCDNCILYNIRIFCILDETDCSTLQTYERLECLELKFSEWEEDLRSLPAGRQDPPATFKKDPGNNMLSVATHQQTSPRVESKYSTNCTQTVTTCDMVVPQQNTKLLPINTTTQLRCSTTDNKTAVAVSKSNNACFYMSKQNLDLDYCNVKPSNTLTAANTAAMFATVQKPAAPVKDINVKLVSCNETTNSPPNNANESSNTTRKTSMFSSLLEFKKDFEMNTLKSNDQFSGLDDNKNVESVILPTFLSRNTFELGNRWRSKASASAAKKTTSQQQQQSNPLPTSGEEAPQQPKRENLHLNLNTYASLLNLQGKIHTTFEKSSTPPKPSTATMSQNAAMVGGENSNIVWASSGVKATNATRSSTSENNTSSETEVGTSGASAALDAAAEPPPEFYDNKIWREWECLRNKTGEIISPELPSYSFDPNNLIKYAKNVNRTVTFKRYYPAASGSTGAGAGSANNTTKSSSNKSRPKNPQPLYI